MTALNNARKAAGQKEVDENAPSIYAMENKSGWRIDGAKWKDVCSLSACLIVIRDICTQNLKTYIQHHPTSKANMQPVNFFLQWMLEWASNLILTYKLPEIKKQLDVRLECLEDSKARSVDWFKAPQVLTDYLQEHFEPFYRFHFPCSSDEDSDGSDEEEGSARKKGSDNDTESEQEFGEGQSGSI